MAFEKLREQMRRQQEVEELRKRRAREEWLARHPPRQGPSDEELGHAHLMASPLPKVARDLWTVSELRLDYIRENTMYFRGDGRLRPRSGFLQVNADGSGWISGSGGWLQKFDVKGMTQDDAEKLLLQLHKKAKEVDRPRPSGRISN